LPIQINLNDISIWKKEKGRRNFVVVFGHVVYVAVVMIIHLTIQTNQWKFPQIQQHQRQVDVFLNTFDNRSLS